MSALLAALSALCAAAGAQAPQPAPPPDRPPVAVSSAPAAPQSAFAALPAFSPSPGLEKRGDRAVAGARRLALTLAPDASAVDVPLGAPLGVRASARAGLVHPFAGGGDMLKASPFAAGFLDAAGKGALDWRAKFSAGAVDVRSAPVNAGAPDWRSPAADAPGGAMFSHVSPVVSAYAEAGKGFRAGDTGLAVYAGAGTWTALGRGNADANVGVAASRRAAGGRVTASLDAQGELGVNQLYRNQGIESLQPEGLYARLSYARQSASVAWKAAVDAVARPWTTQVNPSISLQSGKTTLDLGFHEQTSRSPFLPSERGVVASLARDLTDRITATVSASYDQRRYAAAPGPNGYGEVFFGLSFHSRRPAPEVAISARPLLPLGSRRFSAPGPAPAATADDYARLDAAFRQAKTYPDFVRAVAAQAKDYPSLLGMLGAFGGAFSENNYNNTEGQPPNADSQEAIYDQVRASWLDGQARKTGVCITQSQFNAQLANAVAQLNGLDVHAMAALYDVPDAHGKQQGHSLLALVGPDGKVTIQDWEGLRPMGTTDVLEALRLYQDLQGVPAAYWEVTDPKTGRHAAYEFTPEGTDILDATTVFGRPGQPRPLWGGEPRGNTLTRDAMEKAAEDASRRP